MPQKIAIIPGDGIGIDVTAEAVRVLECAATTFSLDLEYQQFDYGAEKYLATGISLPNEALEDFRQNYNAIFVGALGDPRIPDMIHARDILLGMRFKLDLFANVRPVKLYHERLCPLKEKKKSDVDFVVFRENTEGTYVGVGGHFKKGTPHEVAIQESINTYYGIHRIITKAFEYARATGRKKVTMSDKNNAMRFEGDLWLRTFHQVAAEFPDIEAEHMFIDVLTMQMVKKPEQFSVIVTSNMFGDIISDLGASLAGGLGIAGSANLHPGCVSLFEPVHGSAPKYAGKNIANPFAAIITLSFMLDYLGHTAAAAAIDAAVASAIDANECTKDLGGSLGTREAGDAICTRIKHHAH